jgi:hypothetical protein
MVRYSISELATPTSGCQALAPTNIWFSAYRLSRTPQHGSWRHERSVAVGTRIAPHLLSSRQLSWHTLVRSSSPCVSGGTVDVLPISDVPSCSSDCKRKRSPGQGHRSYAPHAPQWPGSTFSRRRGSGRRERVARDQGPILERAILYRYISFRGAAGGYT